MAELHLTKHARTELVALPASIRDAVIETLTDIESAPEEAGKELRGRLKGLWSCRVGNYRVLYTIEKRRIIVRAIRHRARAYPPQ